MRSHRTAVAAVAALLLVGCGGGASEEDVAQAVKDALADQASASASAAAAQPAQQAQQSPAAQAEPEPAGAAPAADVVDFSMPDLRGTNLQDAQNAIQEHGVFYSISHDLLGSRNQVLDSNWLVCDQTPAAGTQITGPAAEWEGKIDFGVVKTTEVCP